MRAPFRFPCNPYHTRYNVRFTLNMVFCCVPCPIHPFSLPEGSLSDGGRQVACPERQLCRCAGGEARRNGSFLGLSLTSTNRKPTIGARGKEERRLPMTTETIGHDSLIGQAFLARGPFKAIHAFQNTVKGQYPSSLCSTPIRCQA